MRDDPAVARVQAWLSDEREAGRLVFGVDNKWIAKVLDTAYPNRTKIEVEIENLRVELENSRQQCADWQRLYFQDHPPRPHDV